MRAMRPRDYEVFRKTARRFSVWILVRITNKWSLEYIGHRLYQPKPITCKPKTADHGADTATKKIRGLVADPVRWPAAFAGKSKALDLWNDFRTLHGLGEFERQSDGSFRFPPNAKHTSASGYAIDIQASSKHEGCVTYEGKYLYGDYDLFDIVPSTDTVTPPPRPSIKVGPLSGATKEFQATNYTNKQFDEIKKFLNGQLGFEMVQHGAAYDQIRNDLTLKSENAKTDLVVAFGPNGEIEWWGPSEVTERYRLWKRDLTPIAETATFERTQIRRPPYR
jgi:hypothetical protein